MKNILTIFTVVFLTVSAAALGMSIFGVNNVDRAKNCRSASWTAFLIGLILLYLQFVLP